MDEMKRSSPVSEKNTKRQRPVWPAAQEHVLLEHFGAETVEFCKDFGIRIVVVPLGRRYSEYSPYNREHPFEHDVIVNGTYIVCERTIYVRNLSPGTLVHEAAHAILDAQDVTLRLDPDVQAKYAEATARNSFVSGYCAHHICEWHAECVRAYCNAPNYEGDPATRERLREVDPVGYLLAKQFVEMLSAGQHARRAA